MQKRRTFLFAILFYSVSSYALAGQRYQVIDGVGRKVVLSKPASRIITLAPNLTEMVYSIGAGKKLVGVSAFSDYPQEAKTLPVVNIYNRLDIERIIALSPDLVIAWSANYSSSELHSIQKLNIPIYIACFNHIHDIPKVMSDLAVLTNTTFQASMVIQDFKRRYKVLSHRYHDRKPISVFYLLSTQPLLTLNQNSLIGQAIQLCGGANIFSSTPHLVSTVNLSNVLHLNPQLILLSEQAGSVQSLLSYFSLNNHSPKVIEVHSDWLERYGPRFLTGVEALCEQIDQRRERLQAGEEKRPSKIRCFGKIHSQAISYSSV